MPCLDLWRHCASRNRLKDVLLVHGVRVTEVSGRSWRGRGTGGELFYRSLVCEEHGILGTSCTYPWRAYWQVLGEVAEQQTEERDVQWALMEDPQMNLILASRQGH